MTEGPESVDVPLSWVGLDEVTIAYANQFVIQYQPDGSFVLAIGQATPPPLIGSPEEVRAMAEQIEFVPVRTLTRIGFTETKLRELIAVLEANLKKYDENQAKIDPTRM